MMKHAKLALLLVAAWMVGCDRLDTERWSSRLADVLRMRPELQIGFFSPSGIAPELIAQTHFGMVNAASPDRLEETLQRAQGSAFKVHVDLGPVIAEAMDPRAVRRDYVDAQGRPQRKEFAPPARPKLRAFPSDERLAVLMRPYVDVMARHPRQVGTVFLADEPYLNGIPKAELERAARVARRVFGARGLSAVRLGVIFASGMFDASFAQLMAREAARYASRIDEHYRANRHVLDAPAQPAAADFADWVRAIEKGRLTTYEAAGNLYVGGGIPAGFDVVGFNFYLSTLLLDAMHEYTLDWFAAHLRHEACQSFAGTTMQSVRRRLSFFQDGPVIQDAAHRRRDDALLDALFACRMEATLSLLLAQTAGTPVQLMMISESSSNGVLEFDARSAPEPAQPMALVEARVLDEVRRAQRMYRAHAADFKAGLMFFVYGDERDASIQLDIAGAASMPAVRDEIFRFAGAARLPRP